MRYNPNIRHRRSIRLRTHDYSQASAYFITICTYNRELLLVDRLVREIVSNAWRDLARRVPHVRVDQLVAMPNHVHGIIWIVRPAPPVGAQHRAWPDDKSSPTDTSPRKPPSSSNHAAPLRPDVELALPNEPPRPIAVEPGSLGAIVRAFKSRSTKRIHRLHRTPNAPVWQRNYYEQIIRNETALARIRQYIVDNPAKWAEDKNNPANWPKPNP
ncbi:MAG TPA: transposase [Dehalococcoidia bacterium]|nr:transposase [Dehalococcoidia bacterium]